MTEAQPIHQQDPHAEAAEASLAIVALAERDPERTWSTSELVRALPEFGVLAVVLAVAELHRSGALERVGVAAYRAATAGPAATAIHNQESLWGGHAS